jgi:glycosyltransferase involved in cell wall biosynthesis
MFFSPLVSVIIPTYNRADWVLKSIESAISQTYQNLEVIIWNDGSRDETETVILSFKDKRIKYFHENNHGKSYALNNAIKKSRGEYIAFLDDDDQWAAYKLSHQMDLLTKYPEIDLVFGNFLNIDLITGLTMIGYEQNIISMGQISNEKIGDDAFIITGNFFSSLCISNFIAFDTVLIRRAIINKVGYFNENLRNSEDFEYWWRLALEDGKLAYTNEIVLNRIKPQGSLSSPSILTYENKIKGLDSCVKNALAKGRKDLVPYLNRPYRNAWQNLIPLYARNGDRKGMLRAFSQSLRYGFEFATVRLIFVSLNKSKFIKH